MPHFKLTGNRNIKLESGQKWQNIIGAVLVILVAVVVHSGCEV
jgi:hypothetical protein